MLNPPKQVQKQYKENYPLESVFYQVLVYGLFTIIYLKHFPIGYATGKTVKFK